MEVFHKELPFYSSGQMSKSSMACFQWSQEVVTSGSIGVMPLKPQNGDKFYL